MKISLCLLALPTVFGMKKFRAVRKLNDADEDGDVDEYEYLQNYEQIYMTCDAEMRVMNEEGEYEYGSVVTRMCPSGATCDNSGVKKCEGGYGDYVVGIQTYMEQFLDQFQRGQEDNEDEDEENNAFDVGEFGECREFEVEQEDGDDEDGDEQEQVQYFIGPMCSDGDIRIALFSDEDCQYESATSFQELTGVALPWSTSILQDETCQPYYCYGTNENGEMEYNEFCTQVVDQANLKCEEQMETYSPYGKTVAGCETIAAMLPQSTGGGAGTFLIILLVAAVAGFGVWYFLAQKKKTAVNQEGLMM